MTLQTNPQLIQYIGKYGCFFMCVVYWFNLAVNKIELGCNNLNRIWMTALDTKVISGDENHDGDMDDANELLIGDKDKLLAIAGIKLHYLGSFTPDKVDKKKGQHYIGEFYRELTEKGQKKSFTHFAAIDENYKVVYDPLGESVTVAKGFLKTVRVFG